MNWLPVFGAAVITAIVPLLVWYLRRHDTLATQMRESIGLIDDLRRDLMDLEDWAWKARTKWRIREETLLHQGVIQEVTELPPIPESRVSRRQDHDESERRWRPI